MQVETVASAQHVNWTSSVTEVCPFRCRRELCLGCSAQRLWFVSLDTIALSGVKRKGALIPRYPDEPVCVGEKWGSRSVCVGVPGRAYVFGVVVSLAVVLPLGVPVKWALRTELRDMRRNGCEGVRWCGCASCLSVDVLAEGPMCRG